MPEEEEQKETGFDVLRRVAEKADVKIVDEWTVRTMLRWSGIATLDDLRDKVEGYLGCDPRTLCTAEEERMIWRWIKGNEEDCDNDFSIGGSGIRATGRGGEQKDPGGAVERAYHSPKRAVWTDGRTGRCSPRSPARKRRRG